jgi:RHS repeat-associated protein
VSSSNYPNDIDNQSSGNYSYDAIGELTADNASSITGITWTVYGKINTISKSGGISISFTYDAAGNRISKTYNNGSGTTIVTWYVRDAQGNVMSVYTSGDATINSGDLSQTESDLYGSSRLGMLKSATDVYNLATVTPTTLPLLGQGYPLIFTRGNKLFELSNHLGNVLATISDKKWGITLNDSTVDHFNPQVVSANDYYPFGSQMPGRDTTFAANLYRYGFNGKENDNEVKGVGDQQDYGKRIYDPRVGRFLSVDPITNKYPELTPYQFASNTPLQAIDLDGLEGLSNNDYQSHFQQQVAIKQFRVDQAAASETNAQKNATKIDVRHPKPSPMPAKPDATSTAQAVPSDRSQLLRPGQLPAYVPQDQGTISAPDPRSQYTPEEWGIITAPTTQLAVGMMVPGYNLTLGIGVLSHGLITDNNWEAAGGLLAMASGGYHGSSISTPYGTAYQSSSQASLAAMDEVLTGAPLYRLGTLGRSAATEAQFWSLEDPSKYLNDPAAFAQKFGIPAENLKNGTFFIEKGQLNFGASFITREAPGVGTNGGGAVEVVTNPGGVQVNSFNTATPQK